MEMFKKVEISGRVCQVFAVITGTLTVIADGMHYGWTSPIIPLLEASPNSFVHESDVVWIENCLMFGGVAGLFITMCLLDKIGRKATMLTAAVENMIAWILIATSSSAEVLFVARFIAGIAADVNFVAAPVYIAEIADKKIRGRLSSLINIFGLLGLVLIYAVGPYVSVGISSVIGMGFLAVEIITFSTMPESPHYYLMRNNPEAARRSLKVFRNVNVDGELKMLKEIVEKENENRGRPLDLLRVKSNRKAFGIMAVLNISQHFTGLSVMLMNMHIILGEAGLSVDANMTAIEFGLVMVAASIVSTFLIDLVGRKVLLSISSFCTAASLLVLGAYFSVKHKGGDTSEYSWVPVACLMIYAVTHKIGLSFVPIVVTAELFPTNIKAVGCTVADSIFVISSAITIFVFHALYRNFGMHVPFFMFAGFAVLVGLFAIFLMPETKGKTLEEIQEILRGEENEHVFRVETTLLLSASEEACDE
ncbi:hypothetical protein PPYR_12065 [Photinus pyralis]|uniref:Major facilitator superfamily (MFS) profile domain-containing protein n=1 Tax=Photinus pyralis TaxID=7054 RepID=A0A5N4AD32_PHOPY|nr:facilitated trehalose transporter Tret1-like [Photinus pyralis]KAB0795226.1 hypothetical protein PPYR_12065 [Photinus pyralis]